MSALAQAEKEIDWAYWPQDVRRFVTGWNAGCDTKWRSNVLWFDYLKSSTHESSPRRSITFSTLKIPVTPLFSSDMHSNKSLYEFIRGHFSHPATHAIAAMVQAFSVSFDHFYTDMSSKLFVRDKHLAVEIQGLADQARIVGEVKTFVAVAMVGFQSYYGGMEFMRLIKEKAVNCRDLITDQVMKTRVHDILLQIYLVANSAKETLYVQKLNELSALSCRDLGIEPLFCIDQPRSHTPIFSSYRSAVEALRELPTTTSPMDKMSVIIQTTQRICECVDEYWKSAENISPDMLVINADQILSIFVFIVIKAKIRNLMGHINLIIEFVRTNVQQGTYGYYLATLEASIEHILLFTEKKDGESAHGNESFHTCVGD